MNDCTDKFVFVEVRLRSVCLSASFARALAELLWMAIAMFLPDSMADMFAEVLDKRLTSTPSALAFIVYLEWLSWFSFIC